MQKLYFLFWIVLVGSLLGSGASAQSYLGAVGGFEGPDVVVDNSLAYPTGGQAGKWAKSNISQTIALQSSLVRSGNNALLVNNTTTTLRRVYTPLFNPANGERLVIQYFRRVASTTNTQESYPEISRTGSTLSMYSQGSATVPATAGVWEKVVYSPAVVAADFPGNTWASISHRRAGTGGDLYIDDVAVYTSSTGEDVSAPDPVATATATPYSSNPGSEIDLNYTAPASGLDGGGILIVRYNQLPNPDNDPNPNGIYNSGNTISNGTGGLTGTVVYSGTATNILNVGLKYGTTYYYKIYTYDKAYNYSPEVTLTVTTQGREYYSKSTGALNDLSTWGTNPDGSGTQPTSFTTPYQIFHAENQPAAAISGDWNFAAMGSRLIVGNGVSAQTVTFPTAYSVGGTIDVQNEATLVLGNRQIPNLLNLGTTSTVVYNYSGLDTQYIAARPYGNLVLTGASTKIPVDDLVMAGNLTVTNGTTFAADGFVISLSGNWLVNNGAVYNHGGNLRSSVNFRTNKLHTLASTGEEVFSNLKVFDGGTVRLQSNIRVDSTLALISGKLALAQSRLRLNGSFVGSAVNSLSGSMNAAVEVGVTYRNGTLFFDQSADSANYLTRLIDNLDSDTLFIGNKLRIAPHTVMNGMSGLVKVATGGHLMLNDTLILVSNMNGTARIGASAAMGNYLSGIVSVQKWIPAKKAWYLLTAPLVNSEATVLNGWMEGHTFPDTPPAAEPAGFGTHITGGSNNFSNPTDAQSEGYDYSANQGAMASIRVYESNNWNNAPGSGPANLLFSDYAAYLLWVRGDRKIDLNNPNAASMATTLRPAGIVRQGNAGGQPVSAPYSLIGNPYPSPLDFEKMFATASGIEPRFYKWDARLAGSGGHVLVQRTAADAYIRVPVDMGSTIADIQHIPSGEGFFVSNTGASVNLLVNESHKSDSINTNTVTTAPAMNMYVNVYRADTLTDGILAMFGNGVDGIDAMDAPKPMNMEENLGLRRSAQTLMLEARPMITNRDTLFLHFTNQSVRSYSFRIRADQFSGQPFRAFLIDSFLHTSTPLDLNGGINTYNFSITSDPGSMMSDRFMVVFNFDPTLPVTITSVKAYPRNSEIAVDWNVSNESNMIRYEVEKSVDGNRFNKATAVQAVNASNGMAQYSWLDIAPVQGNNYYRIRSVGANGEVRVSNIVRVNMGRGGAGNISIYPNPVTGRNVTLLFTNMPKGLYSLHLYNSTGQKVFSGRVSHDGGTAAQTFGLNRDFAKGNYHLHITGEGVSLPAVKVIIR